MQQKFLEIARAERCIFLRLYIQKDVQGIHPLRGARRGDSPFCGWGCRDFYKAVFSSSTKHQVKPKKCPVGDEQRSQRSILA